MAETRSGSVRSTRARCREAAGAHTSIPPSKRKTGPQMGPVDVASSHLSAALNSSTQELAKLGLSLVLPRSRFSRERYEHIVLRGTVHPRTQHVALTWCQRCKPVGDISSQLIQRGAAAFIARNHFSEDRLIQRHVAYLRTVARKPRIELARPVQRCPARSLARGLVADRYFLRLAARLSSSTASSSVYSIKTRRLPIGSACRTTLSPRPDFVGHAEPMRVHQPLSSSLSDCSTV
jgi:hypothetical protein